MLIEKGGNSVENRRAAITLTIEILKTQPELLPQLGGKQIAKVITEVADSLIEYITGEAPKPNS